MKKFHLLTLWFLFFSLYTFAQSNYKPGLVVNAKGDTVRGYINVKEWEHNPVVISFKESLSAASRKLGLDDITFFEVSNYFAYRAYTVSISLNSIDIASPAAGPDTSRTTAVVFLKIIHTGPNVTLFSYSDKLKQRYYIKDKTMASPQELIYGIYQSADNYGNFNANNAYRNQLSQLCTKYQPGNYNLMTKIQQSSYDENNLAIITSMLNGNNMQQTKILLNRQQSVKVRVFAGAGYSSGTIKAGQYYSSPSSTSGAPSISAGIDLIPAPAVGRLIFRLSLTYTSRTYTFNNNSDPIYNIANPVDYKINVKQNTLFITPQVIYNVYNSEKLKVFAGVGYSLNELSYSNNALTAYQGGKIISSPSEENNFDSKGEYSSFQFKSGILLNRKFEISAAYCPSADLSNSLEYTNSETDYQLQLSYIF
jgi:hypothetical protein